MTSWLKYQIEKMDRSRARPSRLEPERLVIAQRNPATTRKICLDCRRVPEEAMFAEYHKKWEAASDEEREHLPWWRTLVGDTCPVCKGRLIEVTQ